MTKYFGVEEVDIRHEILRLLSDGRVWSNGDIKRKLRQDQALPLSHANMTTANFRPNEEKWEQHVNNALSLSRSNSLTAKGSVETVDLGHHRITDAGRKEFERHDRLESAFSKNSFMLKNMRAEYIERNRGI